MRRTPENGDRGREPGIIIHLIRLERIYQLGTFITVKNTEKRAAKLAQTRPADSGQIAADKRQHRQATGKSGRDG